MNSACVDLIYLDPPFNSGQQWSAPIGSEAAGATFKDAWNLSDINIAEQGIIRREHPKLDAVIRAAGEAHSDSMRSYLIYMGVRIAEMKRILKPTGSIYLHCDDKAGAWIKTMMDAVFGQDQFRNEIVWCYTTPSTPYIKQFVRGTDYILWYSNGDQWVFNKDDIRIPYKGKGPHGGQKWSDGQESLQDWRERKRRQGKIPENWWEIAKVGTKKERTGYPTQKPLALLERIIAASSNDGDMVLDPCAGCATACVAAEKSERQWAGIDISPLAADLVRLRLDREVGMFWQGAHRTDIPGRTDLGAIPAYNSRENKETLFGRQRGYCNGCEVRFDYRNLAVDHIVPQSKGGGHHIDNLQLLCPACNSKKGSGSHAEMIAKLVDEGIRK